MGVSGTGKSTLGRALAGTLGWRFIEGDDFHPQDNIDKMSRGEPLDDHDRAPWLARLNDHLRELDRGSLDAVVACSALKAQYRASLAAGIDGLHFIFLHGSAELIRRRLEGRDGHFMPTSLLGSQLDTLEAPGDAIGIDIAWATPLQVDRVLQALRVTPRRPDNCQGDTLVGALAFPEGPRWREGRLWFTDQHAHAIYALSPEGVLEQIAPTEDLPGGLGWLPDGTLLVVYMTQRRVMRLADDGTLKQYADLSSVADFHCNDMLVDRQGRAYVGNFGYDLHGGAPPSATALARVDPDGWIGVAADELVFPNGCALMPDGKTLLVAETFAHRITAFDVGTDGGLSGRRLWAGLGEHTPDGICLDGDGALWVASPGTASLLRIDQGGAVRSRCQTRGTPYACALGGGDRRTLFVCTSETDDPETAARRRTGRIEQARAKVRAAQPA